MERWNPEDRRSASREVLLELDFPEGFPKRIDVANEGVAYLMQMAPGIFELGAKSPESPPLIITGGIHGDEKAGIVILDRLINGITTGAIRTPVKRSALLMYGNLQAMKVNDMVGARYIEPEVGVTANLNRCFGHGMFKVPRCYAERRANEMMDSVGHFVKAHGVPEVIDIHQSFKVPQLQDVRGGPDRSDYTYAMIYPINGDLETSLRWIYDGYSDIVAGAVISDMSEPSHTFAGYMASTYGAHAATFEQGTIGYIDWDTFVPQLQRNLARKLAGETALLVPEGMDVWKCVKNVIKQTNDFCFVDRSGEQIDAPHDFVPQHVGTFARDGDVAHTLNKGQRLLFAKADVPIGDRTAAVIEIYDTDLVPTP